jgi:L-2-hydroxyglutarate oxidase LhgO
MERIDTLVAGAGVIGLAIARRLALSGREVIVAEAAGMIGTETSSRNSEVIHAGIYYPAGSLKARLCVPGREALYAYCAGRGIAHRRIGKLIVAAETAQIAALKALRQRAVEAGAGDLQLLSAAEARAFEPELTCAAALLSPHTGIVDGHALMLSLQGEAEDAGAMIAFHTPVIGARVTEDGFEVDLGGAAPMTLACRTLVNAAGLGAWDLARRIVGLPPTAVPAQWLAKGNYYALSEGQAPFRHLIYPMPEDGGLGVHLTLDLAGQARFGPDVEWLPSKSWDYTVDPGRAAGFYTAIRRYWPSLQDGGLVPAYCGIRPKLSGPGRPVADFQVDGPRAHGISGLINLFGIESPGLTCCLSLADLVLTELETPGGLG